MRSINCMGRLLRRSSVDRVNQWHIERAPNCEPLWKHSRTGEHGAVRSLFVLKKWDSIFIPPNEGRAIKNNTQFPASMMVILGVA